ncbi:hypothetical protein ABZ354_03055 [Streptomyces sp. NPDC005925]|uniref:SCO2584 family spore wall biosynthesis protein n=1 Tax=Streptomyces sp. NPDC005925 TaxID=3157172 RepID=UPI003404A2FB
MTPQVYSGSVAEDVGGSPFPDGGEPDDDRGVPDEEFASVVFDEAFVQAAEVHEPTAVERLLAAARARREASEAESRRRVDGHGDFDPDDWDDGDDLDDADFPDNHHGGPGYGKQIRWHRPVAWVLALVMGVGMVALAFTAVYRGASSGNREQVPTPASTGLEQGTRTSPSAPAGHTRPAVPALPRTP